MNSMVLKNNNTTNNSFNWWSKDKNIILKQLWKYHILKGLRTHKIYNNICLTLCFIKFLFFIICIYYSNFSYFSHRSDGAFHRDHSTLQHAPEVAGHETAANHGRPEGQHIRRPVLRAHILQTQLLGDLGVLGSGHPGWQVIGCVVGRRKRKNALENTRRKQRKMEVK